MSPDVVTYGETMALFAAEDTGKLSVGSRMNLRMGGAESNVAIGLARLGTSALWAGRVGADPLGQLVAREIRAEGVTTVAIVDSEAPTGLMVKERRTPGTSRVYYYRSNSAGSRLDVDDVPVDAIRAAKVLHISGITMALSPSSARAVRYGMEVAREAGVTVSFDVNYRSRLWSADSARQAFSDILPLVDIVFAGADEGRLILDNDSATEGEVCSALGARGPAHVIIKLGADGAIAAINGAQLIQRPHPVVAVDTVGAGDAFAAGYLSELVRGGSAADALQLAALAGAFVCLSPGDWEGLPHRDDLELLQLHEDLVRR